MASNSEFEASSRPANERWNRVDQLLQSTLEREPAQRAAFLREACAGDESLLREVESLLRSHEQARDFLERPPVQVALERFAVQRAGLLVGRRLGPYELSSLLGSGGMGEVYRAIDTRLKRFIAIKFLSADSSLDEKRLQYFEREARVASALNHPNIVTIYDIGRSEFGPYIAMELVEGKTLRDTLADGPLPMKRVLQLAAQVADGLAKAHAAGIFHRDLKPENLMITSDGLVKILDFGLAKLAAAPNHPTQSTKESLGSNPGLILGTVGYMSPEQASGLSTDFRSDQFSLGTILYEILTGRRAFQRPTAVETLSAIIRDEPEPIALVNPTVPMNVRWIIERCLAKNADERYAATLDLGRDLRNLRDQFSAVANWDASGTLPAPASGISKPARAFAAGAFAMLVVAAVIGVLLRNPISAVPTFRQISFGHGSITGARFAPDGQSVIYGASWAGQPSQLFITQPGNPESRSLGLSEAGIWSVSSSGEMAIAYPCAQNWGECVGTLARVPVAGGVPHEVLEQVTAADWAPDGKTLVVSQLNEGKARIIQYPGENVLYETGGWITGVRVSPKEGWIAFLEHPVLGDVSGSVSILDFMGKKKVLSGEWKALVGLEWSPGGDQVWFTGSRETCGDKLLVLGRGARFQVETADYPASILFYVNPNAPGSEKVKFTELQGIMRQAGHKFRSVKGREELAVALKTARFDIVLADFDDARRLEEMIQASPSRPLLLPWVYQETKEDAKKARLTLAAAKERYQFVLNAPLKPRNFLSTIDRTMEMKSKQTKAQARAHAKASATKISLSQ